MLNVPLVIKLPQPTDTQSMVAFADHSYGGNQGWRRHREATVFKTVSTAASGNTAVWTPGTNNRFRLLGYFIEMTEDATTAGGADVTFSLQDGTTAIGLSHVVWIPGTSSPGIGAGYQSGHIDLGGIGYLSLAPNNTLNLNLSAALTAGLCNIIALGCEE